MSWTDIAGHGRPGPARTATGRPPPAGARPAADEAWPPAALRPDDHDGRPGRHGAGGRSGHEAPARAPGEGGTSGRNAAGSPVPAWAPPAVGAVLVGLGVATAGADTGGGTLGLVTVLPPVWWAGVALVTVGFARLVAVAPGRRVALAAHLVVIVVALHATPGLIEAHGRFPTAWTHVGFVDHVTEHGAVDPTYDARYNWPGAFSFGSLLVDVTGAESARDLVRYAPVVVNLLLLAPLALVVSHVSRDTRVRWAAMWMVVVTNWVGQDYLAPQPLALAAYLTVVGVLLCWFRRLGPEPASRVDLLARARRRWPRAVGDLRLAEAVAPAPPASTAQRVGLLVVVVAVGAALSFTHQLTPFTLVVASAAVVVAGRVDRPLLPVIFAVCAVAWATFGATAYLRSNLTDLASGLGDVGSVVEDNQGRVGPEPARQLVLGTRAALTAVAGLVGGFGFWRQWRAQRADWGLLGLATAPAGLALLNPYGGEIVLRVSLFALPFLAILGAFALVAEGADGRRARRAGVVFGVMAVAALPLFVVARYGNEAFERIDGDDIAAWDYLVDNGPEGATVVVVDFAGPWRYSALTRFEYRVFADEVGGRIEAGALDRLVRGGEGPGYLVLGTGSDRFRQVAEGYPEGWDDALVMDLVATGDYDIAFEAGETRVLARREEGP